MIPSPLIDYAVWVNLDDCCSTELALLKGHLMVEVMLSEAVETHTTLTCAQVRALSFSRKLMALSEASSTAAKFHNEIQAMQQLNRLRNRLAHEPFPQGLESDLLSWSEHVLSCFLRHKHQKFTSRTRVTQAIAALARSVYDLAHAQSQNDAASLTQKISA